MSEYLPAILITLAVCVALVALVGLGWRNRLRRQGGVAAPAEVPPGLGDPAASAEGQYVSTTTAGDWLDRIAVHSLGVRTNATLEVHDGGILFVRSGAKDLYIPRADLAGVRRDSGMAGKFVERDGLVVLTWRLGDRAVDTGFRPRRPAQAAVLHDAVAALVPPAGKPPAADDFRAADKTPAADDFPAADKDNK
ncbi:PH-like domain-containing protein [Arthrobacter halodurans]|uniref:PH domain-containing protein n=1 Tax=Arthrobacter halodurans TaxID=516699 RepID=A0ABV4UL67_9MICC